MADHPYTHLPKRAFWSPAVAAPHMLDISGLWGSPFQITPRDRIVTYGSCFAQHFSRALTARGYCWHDEEPAPEGLAPETARLLNFGVFSARTGNIYTASLLHQWVDWATAERTPPDLSWEQDGRVHDPFRPAVEPGGFASPQEMLASRRGTLEAFRRSILACNVLVFTLGLTESWHDTGLGVEFPVCPGTLAGRFDPDRHVFRNGDYPSVHRDLAQAIEKIRAARNGRGPRVILTVSPVPLAATASGEHVLVASSGSKAILRAVAGQVARDLKHVAYFPSYEIISAPPYRANFFEPDLRGVNRSGIDHVMTQFFAGLPEVSGKTDTAADSGPGRAPMEAEALACEEEILGSFGPRP
ncbi:GSCFA family protein [Rhodobacterales bacterium HKCCSP123]|nr:GSCFA family protein [Rhodobacterales bacterium HKCCSP123]